MSSKNGWVDILWDESDGLNVNHPKHQWGVTGCSEDRLEYVLNRLSELHPNATFSIWFDNNHVGLKQHLAETNRSL